MNLINGTELNSWRVTNKLTLNDVGDLLGEVSGPTVSRWENGQDIPGPVQKLLAWLIKGIEPFDRATAPQHVKAALWRVEMSLGAWERLESMRTLAGYGSLSDWFAAMLREELQAQAAADRRGGMTSETAVPARQPGALVTLETPMRKVADEGGAPVAEGRLEVKYRAARRKTKPE